MKQAILVVGDDDKLYKNPRLAGMVDEDLCEFFIAFTPTQAPEIVIERIPNYPPHRGMAAPALWVWYAKAAAVILAQLKIPATKIQKCLSCTREFEGVNQDARRPAKGISFTFDLCGPLPVASISKDEGVFEYEECVQYEGRPEGSFAVVVEEGFEPRLVGGSQGKQSGKGGPMEWASSEEIEDAHQTPPEKPVGLVVDPSGDYCKVCGMPFSNPRGLACEGHDDDDDLKGL